MNAYDLIEKLATIQTHPVTAEEYTELAQTVKEAADTLGRLVDAMEMVAINLRFLKYEEIASKLTKAIEGE